MIDKEKVKEMVIHDKDYMLRACADEGFYLNQNYLKKAKEATESLLDDINVTSPKGLRHYIACELLRAYVRIVQYSNGLLGFLEHQIEYIYIEAVEYTLQQYEYSELISLFPQIEAICENIYLSKKLDINIEVPVLLESIKQITSSLKQTRKLGFNNKFGEFLDDYVFDVCDNFSEYFHLEVLSLYVVKLYSTDHNVDVFQDEDKWGELLYLIARFWNTYSWKKKLYDSVPQNSFIEYCNIVINDIDLSTQWQQILEKMKEGKPAEIH